MHRVIAVYGCLHWLNTIAFWGVGVAALGSAIGQGTRALDLAGVLIGIGLLILVASIVQFASDLEEV